MATVRQIVEAIEKDRSRIDPTGELSKFFSGIERASQIIGGITAATRVCLEKAMPSIREFGLGLAIVTTDLRRALDKMDEDHAWLVGLGWPTPMYLVASFPGSLRREVGSTPSPEVQAEIDALMVEAHDPKLLENDLLGYWSRCEMIQQRMPLLRECIRAHNEEMYWMVPPLILSQLEGVVLDAVGIQGWCTWEKYKQQISDLLEPSDHASRLAFLRLVQDQVLVDFFRGQPLPSQISRHAILHGADTKYGTASNSLRSILTLDNVIHRIHDRCEEQRKKLAVSDGNN